MRRIEFPEWPEALAQAQVRTEDLRARGEKEVAEFLDSLALNEQLSASRQRQALNAVSEESSGRVISESPPSVWRHFGHLEFG